MRYRGGKKSSPRLFFRGTQARSALPPSLCAALMHGDVVARACNTLGQTGVVVDVRLMLDLLEEVPAGSPAQPPPRLLRHVPSSCARHVRCLHPGDHVLSGAWLGRCEEVCDSLLLRTSDGALVRIPDATPAKFIPRRHATLMSDPEDCPYFPGQRVSAANAAALRTGRWLQGAYRGRLDCVVVAVEPGEARVRWLAAVGAESPEEPPPHVLLAEGLTRLSAFDHVLWQLGDRCLVRREELMALVRAAGGGGGASSAEEGEGDGGRDGGAWRSAGRRKSRRRGRRAPGASATDARASSGAPPSGGPAEAAPQAVPAARITTPSGDAVARVVRTRTLVDVQWQDSSLEVGVEAKELVPMTHLVDGDFWAEEFVCEKHDASAPLPPPSAQPRIGLVRSVDARQRTAAVSWLQRTPGDGRVVLPASPELFADPETAPVYDLEPAPDYAFHLGDCVLLLDVGTAADSAAAFVGQITAIRLGRLTVAWADGHSSVVAPEDVFTVQPEEGEGEEEEEEGEEEEEWEEQQPDAHAFGAWLHNHPPPLADDDDEEGDGQDESGWQTDGDEEEEAEQEEPVEVPAAPTAEQVAAKAAADARAQELLRAMADSLPPAPVAAAAVAGNARQMLSRLAGGWLGSVAPAPAPAPAPAVAPPPTVPAALDGGSALAHFDTVVGAEDHLYFAEAAAGSIGSGARAWTRAVRREWDLLQAGLPADIWVRAYEDRMDLLRCVVAAADDTPYARHLFVFDLHFGAAFPSEPPGVTFHAHGMRCNPNLYANGKVCLSLLGTWAGRDGESWRPGESSTLQVLLSIQALVLNAQPYFNEPGWAGQQGSDEGARNSRLYNEQVRLVGLRAALALLRQPPQHFGALVRHHYARHARPLLHACEADLAAEDVDDDAAPSAGYKASLAKVLPRLQEALGPLVAHAQAD